MLVAVGRCAMVVRGTGVRGVVRHCRAHRCIQRRGGVLRMRAAGDAVRGARVEGGRFEPEKGEPAGDENSQEAL